MMDASQYMGIDTVKCLVIKTSLMQHILKHKKSDRGSALDKFVWYYGAPDLMIHEGSKDQSQPGTEFQKSMRNYDIKNKVSEPECSNTNSAEGFIQELGNKWYRTMFKSGCP